MNLRRTLFTALILAATLASASAIEKPLWEELTKTEEMFAADKAFVEAIRKNMNGDLKEGAKMSLWQGWDAFGKGDMNVAIRRFNQAWLLDPENGDIYWGFALATHVRGDGLDQSERWFAEAERLSPTNAQMLADHGRTLDENGVQPHRARTYFERALVIDPGNLTAHIGLGRLLPQLGDEAGAEKHRAEADRLRNSN